MTIRKAEASDIPCLEVFQKQLYGDSFDVYHADLTQAVSNGCAWVATERDEIIGYQICELFGPTKKYFPNSIFLSELIVATDHRKQGVGSRLIQAALDEPWSSTYEYFSLTHDPNDTHLTGFYQKFGFVVCGKTEAGNVMMRRNR